MSDQGPTGGQFRSLEQRVESLELLVLRAQCVVTAALLIAGVLIPFGYHTEDDEEFKSSVLSMPWQMIESGSQDSGADADEMVFGIVLIVGFLGLLGVVAAMLITLVAFARRAGREGTLRFAQVLRVLGFIGTAVILLFTMAFVVNENLRRASLGWGGVVLFLGMLGYLWLLTDSARERWLKLAVPRSSR